MPLVARRSPNGQFGAGNPGGPGNPYARRVAALRTALMDAVTDDDIRAVAKALVKRAKAGEVPAIRELLDRLVGKTTDKAEHDGPPIINVSTGIPDEVPDDDHDGRPVLNVITGVPRK